MTTYFGLYSGVVVKVEGDYRDKIDNSFITSNFYEVVHSASDGLDPLINIYFSNYDDERLEEGQPYNESSERYHSDIISIMKTEAEVVAWILTHQ